MPNTATLKLDFTFAPTDLVTCGRRRCAKTTEFQDTALIPGIGRVCTECIQTEARRNRQPQPAQQN